MNLLLLAEEEVRDAQARVGGHRARHLLDVLRVSTGDVVRCGVIDGPLGSAEVQEVGDEQVALRCTLDEEAPPAPHTLLLAVPRPRVLHRVVRDAVCFGFGRLVLFRSWKVDRSHMLSRAMADASLERSVHQGLAQSRRTRRPEIVVEPLFKPFVEDRLTSLTEDHTRLVAHPGHGVAADRQRGPVALAVGPERGFTEYEVESLQAAGFSGVHVGRHPLRVEAAVAALCGALLSFD